MKTGDATRAGGNERRGGGILPHNAGNPPLPGEATESPRPEGAFSASVTGFQPVGKVRRAPTMREGFWTLHAAATLVGLIFATGAALAGPVPDDDWDWATIGDPGNAAYTKQTGPDAGEAVGAVNDRYRIAKTEVTVSQWSEFATAFAPFVPEWITHQGRFTGRYNRRHEHPDGSVYYTPIPGTENIGEQLGWEFALRYCNWLHNGKVNEAWAFETGAYDLRRQWADRSDFFDGIINLERNPDARFWLPNEDEWVKAMHYDPNRNGLGQGGYWLYPHSSDSAPIPGYPEDGGQTDAGLDIHDPNAHFVPVGSYTDVLSPWGLYDGSGGANELVFRSTLDIWDFWVMNTHGSQRFQDESFYWDNIDASGVAFPRALVGFRVASIVPTPSSVACCGVLAAGWLARRRR